MKEQIRKWYEGEFILYHDDPTSEVIFANGGHFKRHWTAKLARWAVSFYLREWKWTLGALATVIGALVFKKF